MRKDGRRVLGDSLLEQEVGRPQHGLAGETALHRPIEKKVGEGEEAHPLVMRHERAHRRAAFTSRQARGGVIDRFIKAVRTLPAVGGKALEIAARCPGPHHQRHHPGVRRDDQVIGQTALQSESRHAESAVTIVQVHVSGVIAGLGNAPVDPALFSVIDLSSHHRVARPVQQRLRVGGHDQKRHQILEHRAAPAQ